MAQSRRHHRQPAVPGRETLKPERGREYVASHAPQAYPEVPGMADYCVYWFRKAHDHLPAMHRCRSRGWPRWARRHAKHP